MSPPPTPITVSVNSALRQTAQRLLLLRDRAFLGEADARDLEDLLALLKGVVDAADIAVEAIGAKGARYREEIDAADFRGVLRSSLEYRGLIAQFEDAIERLKKREHAVAESPWPHIGDARRAYRGVRTLAGQMIECGLSKEVHAQLAHPKPRDEHQADVEDEAAQQGISVADQIRGI